MIGENRYLIIGIDEYPRTSYNRLYNAKVDGSRLAKVLEERYGFTASCDPIYDVEATADNIVDALHDLVGSDPEDNLIIYFAGHGVQHPTSKKGFWMPHDGESDRKKWIDNSVVLNLIQEIQAKHILLISDSCYSGTFITRTRDGKILTSEELEALASRWVFVSGGEEPVKDGTPGEGSPFGIALCSYLEKNMSPILTAGELFNEVLRVVENQGGQQPAASSIECEAHKGGQMVFRLKMENKGSGDEPAFERPIFELPAPKIKFYIPRLLRKYDHQEDKEIRFYQPEVGTIYLNSLIRTQKRVVVLGAAGSGKSVELLSLAHQLQNGRDPINPIFKRFNTYTEENIADYLPKKWAEADPNNLILFLDGLDEIQPKHFQTAIRKIMTFTQQNPLVRIVISCRNNFYELPYDNFSGTLDGFSVYTLTDVSVPEIIKYVTDEFELDGEDFITKIHQALFLDLVQKPFFLNILIQYYKDHQNFESGRAGIMEEALLKYYENDKQHFNATVPTLSKPATFAMLEKVAFVMEVIGRNFLNDEDIVKIFQSVDEQQRCKYLPAFNRDDESGRWMFEHNNLQEYISSRVLDTKSVAEIVHIISVKTTGEMRIKPSWVNTISFFMSIGKEQTVKELFNWIIEHDREIIVKFEPERLSIAQRVQLFKDIFNFYTNQGIWLRSNKFTDVDLARFGESAEVLSFLLDVINSRTGGRVGTLNAVHILSHYHIRRFYNRHEMIRDALLGLLEIPEVAANDAYTIIGALSELRITNDGVIDQIVSKYRERRNQYIRAAMYKLIITAKKVDEYIDVFIDGIDFSDLESPASDRENVNLFDENLLLKIGLQNVKTAEGLKILLEKLVDSQNKRELLTSDYKEVLTKIVNVGAILYHDHNEIFDAILKLFIADAAFYHSPWDSPLVAFFEKTGTRWQAFKEVSERQDIEDYVKGETMNKLLNTEVIQELIMHIQRDDDWQKKLNEFYEFIFWNRRFSSGGLDLIEQYEIAALDAFGVKLERPVYKDWQKIHRFREQESFNLWFDDTAMLGEISRVFKESGLTEINRESLFKFNHQDGMAVEEKMLASVQLVFNALTLRGRIINENEIIAFVKESEEYQNLRIGHIHSDLANRKGLMVNDQQIAFINEWAQTRGNNRKLLWTFMVRFNLRLPDAKVLDLTNYSHLNYDVKLSDPGTIEELEKFITVAKIKEKVAENIQTLPKEQLAWVNNAAYALRKDVIEVYGDIVDRLQAASDFEYKFGELLNIWFARTKDIERLKSLILNIQSNYLRRDAVKIVEDNNLEPEFLNVLFHDILASEEESLDEKIYAANHLMRQNDLDGFNFMADLILRDPDPNFDYRLNLGSMSLVKDVAAIPKLMEMLKIAKQPEYKRDMFNDFEDRILSTLRFIGIQSTENFVAVKAAVETFIEENASTIPTVNFLHFVIAQIEEQIKIKETENMTVDEALAHYGKLF
ncbi:caspase family protein [Mucilaginibacter sp. CAU 1740]|uniref:caspase family protein n=1 Tax=Mucilaginibacter sp. CAU 1740 TaxID=3140365 RepID=UPI00325B3ED5